MPIVIMSVPPADDTIRASGRHPLERADSFTRPLPGNRWKVREKEPEVSLSICVAPQWHDSQSLAAEFPREGGFPTRPLFSCLLLQRRREGDQSSMTTGVPSGSRSTATSAS